MKVFVVGIRGFPNIQGGAEKHCEELYPRIAKLGCNLTAITRTPYVSKEKRLSCWKGVKFIHLWCPRKKRLETISHSFLACITCILKRPKIVHIHNIGPALIVPLLRLFGIKAALTYHSINYEHQRWGNLAKFVLRLGELLGLKFANKVIVISKNTKAFLEKKYLRRDLELISNGVNLSEMIPAGDFLRKYNLEPEKYIFTAGRFVPEKGLHDLIKAYLKLEDQQFKLVIAGDADHETEYSRGIKRLAKEVEGIALTGFVSGRSLAELFSNAGLFVLPSYYEGLPIALLEALSYGLPVLVSDIPGNREVPLPDFRVFPPGNIDVLSKKMVELFEKSISQEEKKKNEELLAEHYNWDVIAQKTHSIYASMIN